MALPQVLSSLRYKTRNNINFSKLKIEVLPSVNYFLPLAPVFICYFFRQELPKLDPRIGWTRVYWMAEGISFPLASLM